MYLINMDIFKYKALTVCFGKEKRNIKDENINKKDEYKINFKKNKIT